MWTLEFGGGVIFIDLVRVEVLSGNMVKTSMCRNLSEHWLELLHVEVLSNIGLKLLRRS